VIRRFHPALLATAAACALLLGCGEKSDVELLASARTYLAQKDNKAAIIQLKTALQQNPQSPETRFLLGKALLDSGDLVAATVELRKAEELKYDPDQVMPALASALLQQGEDRRVVELYADRSLGTPAANADLKTSLATAHARLQKIELAEKALAEALAASPRHIPALLLQARLAASKRDFAAAIATLDGITTQDAAQADAWLLKGDLQQHGLRDKTAALVSYRQAASARMELMPAHQAVVNLLIEAKDVDGARAHVTALKQALPDLPGTRLLEAQMAYIDKNYLATREITQPLLQLAPNNPLLLQLAGAAELQLGALPQAENLLAQAVKLAPGLSLATQALTRVYLRTGQPEKALELIRPAADTAEPPAEVLLLAGEAYLQNGDPQRAEAMFTRAAKQQPDNARARTALALGRIGKGDASGGLAELEAVSAADPGSTADLALIAAHLRRKDSAKALVAVDALAKKQPQNPLPPNLRGRILVARGDAAGARASFERALAIDPKYFPAVISLAALDMGEKKPAEARKRFEAVVAADPKHHRAMLALATLLPRTGGTPQEVTALLGRAIQASPGEVEPRLRLVEHHLASGNPKAALTAAQEASGAQPNSRELVNALGRAQLANNEFQQAVTSYSRLATLQPNTPLAPLGLAAAQLGLKAYDAAEREFKRALEINPALLPAQRGLIQLYVGDGRYAEALAVARQVQKQLPAQAMGWQLEGDIETQRRSWDAALAAFRTAQQKQVSPDSAIKLHNLLLSAKRADEAERYAAQWQKDQPQDVLFRYYLGDLALAASDWTLAEARYREVLRIRPEHALAMNNVAWLLVKQGKPGALPLAEKATSLMPQQTSLLDTLALALAADKQVDKALTLQRKTLEMAPEDPTLRLTLARLLLQSGDKAKARTELEALAKLGKRFRDQAEVAALLKQAQG
jgi:putative PEP-CTERM system TPR-repeat lipoprotein